MATFLRRWMYLDHDGIVSLHSQFRGERIIERTRTSSRSSDKSSKGTAGLAVLVGHGDIAKGAASTRRREISEKTAPTDEKLLLELEAYLTKTHGLHRVARIADIAELQSKGQSALVSGVLRFRWATTANCDPVWDAMAKQMIEFEVHREAHDDAGMLTNPIRMCGSLEKCVGGRGLHDGSMSPTGHLAMFLRQIAHGVVPLGFVAHLHPWPGLILLKPYAIWFP
jgi:hypothetical protein